MSDQSTPKPGPRRPGSTVERERIGASDPQRPLGWSKVRSEPYFPVPINIDLGVRALTPIDAKRLLQLEVERVNAQLDALIKFEAQLTGPDAGVQSR